MRVERIIVDQVALTFIFNEVLIVTYNEERRVNLLGLSLRKELGKGPGQSKAIRLQEDFFLSKWGEEETGMLSYLKFSAVIEYSCTF